MKCLLSCLTIVALSSMMAIPDSASGQQQEDEMVRDSLAVLQDIMAIPAQSIPMAMFRDAHAVAIVPGVIKGSLIVGARHGNGVLLARDESGGWHAPVFISLTGGNIGWQAGVQSTDVILVFRTRQSVSNLLSGKLTLGADAAVAAGPFGRQVGAATDAQLSAELLSYSRSRGVFLGVSFEGAVISMDPIRNANYYRPASPQGPIVIPEAAQHLAMQLREYSGSNPVNDSVTNEPDVNQQMILAQQQAQEDVEYVRDQLANVTREMYRILDRDWQNYLSLPIEVFAGNGHPSLELLDECIERFEVVRVDNRYTLLANHPQFQTTFGMLMYYTQKLASAPQAYNPAAPQNVRMGQRY